jgi:hypothetical protein
MNKKEFNEYCAEVLNLHPTHSAIDFYNDANQRHKVFDKLWHKPISYLECSFRNAAFTNSVSDIGIDQAEREFIMSTMGKANE